MSSTPILDLDQVLPASISRKWLARLIGVIVGLLISLIFILEDQGRLPDWHWPAFNGLLLIPAIYAAIAVHELGHLAGGALVGFKTNALAIGGFVFFKSGRHWSFRFDRRRWVGGFFLPASTVDFQPDRYIWMIAAGPLASLTLTAVCGGISVQHGSGLWNWTGSLFWVSLFFTVLTLIPFSSGLNKSDGKRLWVLWRSPEQARSWVALLALQTEEARGLRPREWHPNLVEQLMRIEAEAGEYGYSQLMLFYRRLDEGDESAALEHLENALAGSKRGGKAFQHVVFLEAACASASIRKRSDQARTWSKRACEMRRPESLDVVEAGIAMCEGRYARRRTVGKRRESAWNGGGSIRD